MIEDAQDLDVVEMWNQLVYEVESRVGGAAALVDGESGA